MNKNLPIFAKKDDIVASVKNYDVTRYGGAPLLGINGLVVKTHGSAKAVEVTITVLQGVTFRENDGKSVVNTPL